VTIGLPQIRPDDVPHNCYGGNAPMLGTDDNNYCRIFVSPDVAAIQLEMEMMHDSRIIPFNRRAPIPGTIRQEDR
jgi:hypothetical protein